MTRVKLPPGCMGFRAQDGTRYTARPGTSVDVADHHMTALKKNDYAQAGLVDAGPEKFYVDKTTAPGRWCSRCRFTGYAWMTVCSKCGTETIPETEMPPPPEPHGQYIP